MDGSKVHVPDYMLKLESGSWVKYRFVTDQIGSVRYVVRESDSTVVQEMVYSPFGEVLNDSAGGFQPFGFAGGLYDIDTNLVRFGARDYDSKIGRWTAKDPILFGGGDTNLYGYVMSDPVNFLDTNGMWLKDPNTAQADYYREQNTPKDFDHRGRNKNNKVPQWEPTPDQGHFFGQDNTGRYWFNTRGAFFGIGGDKYRWFDGSEAAYKNGKYAYGTYNYYPFDLFLHTVWDWLTHQMDPNYDKPDRTQFCD